MDHEKALHPLSKYLSVEMLSTQNTYLDHVMECSAKGDFERRDVTSGDVLQSFQDSLHRHRKTECHN